MKHISRIERPHSGYGWLVRTYGDGKQHSRFFSDRKHGDKAQALDAAHSYLRSLPRPIPKPPVPRPTVRNTTGVHGVGRTYALIGGKKVPCFVVHYKDEAGERRLKRFYPHHYADDQHALDEAAAFRQKVEAAILRQWRAEAMGHEPVE